MTWIGEDLVTLYHDNMVINKDYCYYFILIKCPRYISYYFNNLKEYMAEK